MIDVGNQIVNLLTKYLPYTNLSGIGYDFPVESVVIAEGKVTMTVGDDDYTSIKSIMTNDANFSFTTHGFYTKNNIISFSAYNGGLGDPYAFEVKFERSIILKVSSEITLKGFTDDTYNITYKIASKISSNTYVFYSDDIASIEDVTTGLGYYPVQYNQELNDIVTLTDEGDNQFSFEFDADSYYNIDSEDELDLTENIKIFYYSQNVKVIDFITFQENLLESDNAEYLIIDSTILVGTPKRSSTQTSDSDYYATNRSGSFEKNFTLNIKYLLQRKSDDSDNQTTSGSDLIEKQINMHKALTSILRTPLEGDSTTTFSAITILQDSVEERISSGKTIINYQLGFVATYYDSIMLDNYIKCYPIDQLKVNDDLLVF